MGWFSKQDDGFFLATVIPNGEGGARVERFLGVVHGEAIIGAHFNVGAWDLADKGLPIGFVVPKEGAWATDARLHLVKGTPKKDLGVLAQAYGDVYVAQLAIGANQQQTVRAMLEAQAWPGPSLLIAYSTCIAHGIDMATSMTHQAEAVASGYWPLYRYRPGDGQPLHLDSKAPTLPVADFMSSEARFAMLRRANPSRAEELAQLAQADADVRWHYYSQLAGVERVLPAVKEES